MESILKSAPLNAAETMPLYQQLYEHIRDAILSGHLKKGTKLPSTRALADELGISRNTVLNAYDQLFAEGYLESVGGSGTFVTHVLPEAFLISPLLSAAATHQKPASTRPPRLSQRAEALKATPKMPRPVLSPVKGAFRAGLPALDQFPYELWSRIISRHARRLNPDALAYQPGAGYQPLREAIAQQMTIGRQIRCTPDQVIIVSGSQGALDLAARALLDAGDAAWMEDPGYLGARGALLGVGARLIPVPVDDEGLVVEVGIERAPDAHVVYLTPSHQFPLGVTLSLRRRLALLDWAKSANAYILEDDYDSEYRFAGRPLASLQGLDDAERVIYIGTFSKVLFPALRLGYVIVPPALVEAFLAVRAFTDVHPSILEQMALADFISEGHYTHHVRRMRVLYAQRRAVLLDAIRDLPLEVSAPEAGMHFVGWLPAGMDDHEVSQRAAAQGVTVLPISMFSLEPTERNGISLGYSGVDEQDVQEGVRRLAAAINSLL